MSVTAIDEAQEHAQVVKDKAGTRYTCPYHVRVSSARDGGDVIIAYMESIGRGIGSTLRYADQVNSFAFCESIAPVRKSRSTTEWTVTLQYAPSEEDEQQQQPNPSGQPTDQPLDWRWDIESGSQLVQVPAWRAWNVDAFPLGGAGDGYERPADTLGPVVNSAGVVLDPPLMMNVVEHYFRLSGVVDLYALGWIDPYAGAINEYNLRWHPQVAANYSISQNLFEPYTLKCTGATASYFRQNGENYWRYTYEFRFRARESETNPFDGWLESVLDRGTTRWAGLGGPDGLGGTTSSTDFEAGMADMAAVRGPMGDRIGEPVLLDGHGKPLRRGDEGDSEGVYFRWRVNKFADFRALPLQLFDSV